MYFKEDVQYGVNLDVTSYTDGKRETHNPPGRALPLTVWDFYEVTPHIFREQAEVSKLFQLETQKRNVSPGPNFDMY